MMNKQQKEDIKKKIQAQLLETEQDIANLEELTKPIAPDNAIGRLSRMDAINNRSINQAALNSSRHKLSMLNKALGRINHPEFGICADCGEPIPAGRIMIMPEANLCVHCAS
jgi:DnaK suppressor protein